MKQIYVLIAAYKAQDYIEDCLNSIKAQVFNSTNITVHIVLGIDACNETKEKVLEIKHKYTNLKVIYFTKNMGKWITINSLLDEVPDYGYVQIFDADDKMNRNMLNEMLKHTPCYSMYSGISLIHKSLYDKLGGYRDWRIAADTEFRSRFTKISNYKKLPQLFYRRVHENSLTQSKDTCYNSKLRNKYAKFIEDNKYNDIVFVDKVINTNKQIINNQCPIYIGIATMNTRKEGIKQVLKCLEKQTIKPDKVFIYNNDENTFNATDNGKYYAIENLINEDCYYLTMDDDIYYPPNYIETIINAINTYQCYVTFHGRKLTGLDRNYYGGHKAYKCFNNCPTNEYIDVPGTGVSGFHSSYFTPKNIFNNENKRMSDLLVGEQLAEENKQILLLNHKSGWLRDLLIDFENSCYNTEKTNTKQQEIANKIYKIKYDNSI